MHTAGSIFSQSSLYQSALNEWSSSRDPELRALAINLTSDHRVTPEQEREFRGFFEPPHTGEQLRAALKKYVVEKVRLALPVEPLTANLVADCSDPCGACCPGFDKGVELVNLLKLTGLREVIELARNENRDAWKPLRDVVLDPSAPWRERLNRKLEGKDPESDEVKDFVAAVLDVLNYNLEELKQPFNPTWVTTWTHFAEILPAVESDSWNNSLGVTTIGNDWQIVLRYPAKAAGRLYRPTQLESGYNAYHFPSPVSAGMAVGGHPMDLSAATRRRPRGLFSEYIHGQIRMELDYWLAAGRLIGRTDYNLYQLSRLRKRHHRRLDKHYPDVKLWMPRPI